MTELLIAVIFIVLVGAICFVLWLLSRMADDEPIDLYVIDCTDVDNYLASTKEAEREYSIIPLLKTYIDELKSDPEKEKSIEREIKRLLK